MWFLRDLGQSSLFWPVQLFQEWTRWDNSSIKLAPHFNLHQLIGSYPSISTHFLSTLGPFICRFQDPATIHQSTTDHNSPEFCLKPGGMGNFRPFLSLSVSGKHVLSHPYWLACPAVLLWISHGPWFKNITAYKKWLPESIGLRSKPVSVNKILLEQNHAFSLTYCSVDFALKLQNGVVLSKIIWLKV